MTDHRAARVPLCCPGLANRYMNCVVLQGVALPKDYFAPVGDTHRVEWLTAEEIEERQRLLRGMTFRGVTVTGEAGG